MLKLSERAQHILFAVIQEYSKNPAPVGSNTLVENYQLPYSAATVRAELASLEELGFLQKAHTSSGRIPSHLAYRYFVDSLLQTEGANSEFETNSASKNLDSLVKDYLTSEDMLSAVAHALSRLTNYLSLVSRSPDSSVEIKRVELVFVSERQSILVLMADGEKVFSSMLNFDNQWAQSAVMQLSAHLDKALFGASLESIARLLNELSASKAGTNLSLEELGRLSILSQFDEALVSELLSEIFKLLKNEERAQSTFVHGGLSALLKHPDFQDVEQLRPLIFRIEKGFDLLDLLPQSDEPVVVSIGAENMLDELGQVSIVASPFASPRGIGFVGVLGPIRMNYVKTIHAVSSAASTLSIRK